MKLIKYLKILHNLNPKTIYFNFKYLPFNKAIKFPFFISNRVYLLQVKGEVYINSEIKTGMINIGYGRIGIFDMKRSRTIWEVAGKIVFEGNAGIGHGSKISVGEKGVLELGNNFTITAESSILAYNHIRFGENCLISWDCLIMDTDFHKIYDKEGTVINSPKPIFS